MFPLDLIVLLLKFYCLFHTEYRGD